MKNNNDDITNETKGVEDKPDPDDLFNDHKDFSRYDNFEEQSLADWINGIDTDWVEPIDYEDKFKRSLLYEEAEAAYKPVDSQIIQFIKNFVNSQDKTNKQKSSLKTVFFYITMVIFVLVVCTPIVTMVVLYFIRPENSIVILAAVTASIIEVLVSIIVLPKIVAEYLFNKEEDVANVKIVELMKAYSETMHGYDNK